MNIYQFYNKPKELINWHPDDPENTGIIEHKKDGELHLEDGPAVESPNGYKTWYLNGEIHREDGPAIIEPDGTKAWCLNDHLHREDGPAVIEPNGTKEWWINGKQYSEDEWEKKLNK